STTKNGGLLNSIKSRPLIQFITCDIPNETLSDVGSGPLIFKSLDWANINSYLKKFDIHLDPLSAPQNKVDKSILGQSASRLIERLCKTYP
ncbi:hypothetical protein DF186_15895, partial [Enterococcus hirae]